MLLYQDLLKVRALGLGLDKPEMSFIQWEVVESSCSVFQKLILCNGTPITPWKTVLHSTMLYFCLQQYKSESGNSCLNLFPYSEDKWQ